MLGVLGSEQAFFQEDWAFPATDLHDELVPLGMRAEVRCGRHRALPSGMASRWEPEPLPDSDEPCHDPPAEEPVEPDDPEFEDLPHQDDARWDVFLPDDDQRDPQPEPGDFWTETDAVGQFAAQRTKPH